MEELKAAELTWGTAARTAQDRGNWRDLVRALCYTLAALVSRVVVLTQLRKDEVPPEYH